MTKPTSKSVSETQKTSSRSGTSGPTGATGKAKIGKRKATAAEALKGNVTPPMTARPIASLIEISAKAKAMTPAELRKSLVAAGIIRSDGKLAAVYSLSPKKKTTGE